MADWGWILCVVSLLRGNWPSFVVNFRCKHREGRGLAEPGGGVRIKNYDFFSTEIVKIPVSLNHWWVPYFVWWLYNHSEWLQQMNFWFGTFCSFIWCQQLGWVRTESLNFLENLPGLSDNSSQRTSDQPSIAFLKAFCIWRYVLMFERRLHSTQWMSVLQLLETLLHPGPVSVQTIQAWLKAGRWAIQAEIREWEKAVSIKNLLSLAQLLSFSPLIISPPCSSSLCTVGSSGEILLLARSSGSNDRRLQWFLAATRIICHNDDNGTEVLSFSLCFR